VDIEDTAASDTRDIGTRSTESSTNGGRQAQAGSNPQRGWRSLRTPTASTLLTPAGQSYSPHPATWNVPQEIPRAQQLAPSRTAEIRPAEELNDGVEEGGCRQFLWWMTTMLHSTGRPAHITTPG
jgi:hypothetical protein